MMLGEEHDKTRKFWPCFVLLAQIEKIVCKEAAMSGSRTSSRQRKKSYSCKKNPNLQTFLTGLSLAPR